MRMFIALELGTLAKKEIENIQKELDKSGVIQGRFTEMENLHLTLKFLGEIDEEKVKKVSELLGKIKFNKFEVTLGNVGIFADRDVRIVWIKLAGEEALELQKQIDEQLKGMFKPEIRFMSHVTIARVKQADKKKLEEFLKKIKVKETKIEIKDFFLKKSTLTKKGSIYENIEQYKLI